MSTAVFPLPVARPLSSPGFGRRRFMRVAEIAAILVLVLGIAGIFASTRWSGDDEPAGIPALVAPLAPGTPDPAQIALLWQWDFTSKMHNIDTYLQVAESPTGKVYVSDDIKSEVHVLDAEGNEVDAFGGLGPDPGNFDFGNPNNGWYGGQLGFDADGNLYVFDSAHDRVQKFAPDNMVLTHWDVPAIDNPNTTQTFAFVVGAVDPINGRVYVASQTRPQVLVYDLKGSLMSSWGTTGREEGQLTTPSAIAVAPDGTLWIADKSISRIQHFDPDGTYLGSIRERGGGPGQISQVLGLDVDQNGNIYAAEAGNGRVQIFRPDGTSIMTFNSVPGLGRITRPNSLWVGADGVLFVVDSTHDRVLKLQLPPLD